MEDPKPNLNSTKKPAPEFLLSLIRKIANSASAVISADTQKVYAEYLGDYAEPILDQAAAATIRDWREASKMPTLAFILERCAQALIDKQRRDYDYDKESARRWHAIHSDVVDPAKCPKDWKPEDILRARRTMRSVYAKAAKPLPPHAPSPKHAGAASTGDAVADAVLGELMKRRPSDVSHEEVLGWLEQAKQKQRAYIAKLEACTTEAEKEALASEPFDYDHLPFAAEINAEPPAMPAPAPGAETYQAYAARLAKERLGPTQVPTDPEERKRWAHQKALDSGWLKS